MTPLLPSLEIVTEPFDVESTRPFFEEGLLKELRPIGIPEEELREQYLTRSKLQQDQYQHLETNIEWLGWMRGVTLGYELWGKAETKKGKKKSEARTETTVA